MKQVFPWIPGSSIKTPHARPSRKGARKLASAVRASLQELERRQMLSAGDPTAVTGGPYAVNEGSSVVINGTSSFDSDGTIATYKWDLNYNPALGFRTSVTGGSFA